MGFLVCNVFLKPFVARIRPFNINTAVDIIIKRPTDYAFPSGHTTSSFIAATIIYCQNRKWGYASFILASLIAFSRLYLYVHYPTDIITGIILGLCLGALANFLRRHYLDRISLNV